MREEIVFEFDNLPILSDLGFEAGPVDGRATPVDGRATISFDDEGAWHVTDISLNGHKHVASPHYPISGDWIRGQVHVCPKANPWLYAAIRDRLEAGEFNSTITDKVAEALDEMGVCARVMA